MTEPNGAHFIQPGSSKQIEEPLAFCERNISEMTRKANGKKLESVLFYYMVIGPSLAAPLFVTLGPEWISGKLIPSALSLIAAAAVAWLQLRRPQQLWSIYRTAQRELEDNKTRFLYRIDAYAVDPNTETLLAKNVANILIGVHRQWVPLVPSPERLKLNTAHADHGPIYRSEPNAT